MISFVITDSNCSGHLVNVSGVLLTDETTFFLKKVNLQDLIK